MDFASDGIKQAVGIILSGDREVLEILSLTMRVSLISALIAAVIGAPAGFAIGAGKFRGREFLIAVLNTLMSLPTVTVGLVVYAMISRRGPLGELGLLFTPTAIIIGEVVLALPIVSALSCAAARGIDEQAWKTAATLGAGRARAFFTVLREARYTILAAVVAGFGRVIAEVGSATMLGGNIKGATRTLTTTIAFETGKGEFGFSLALGIILLLIAFLVTGAFHLLNKKV
ncbi:MAG TPA: ABC transporter permease [bacterium]|nr:ABC transporter permease [bacterium]